MYTFHPHMDGHALVLDRSIDSQLVEEPPNTWDLTSPQTKLVYNDSVKRSNNFSLCDIVHDLNHRATLVFIPKSSIHCAHKSTKFIVWHMYKTHENLNYFDNSWFKSITIHGKFKKFDIGDYILVRLCQGHFP